MFSDVVTKAAAMVGVQVLKVSAPTDKLSGSAEVASAEQAATMDMAMSKSGISANPVSRKHWVMIG